MLKKAGIVVATAAAGLLAVSPLAFATGAHHDGPHGDHHSRPVNVDYTNIQKDNLTNDCDFAQSGGRTSGSAVGGSSLLGILNPVTQLIAPVTTQLNALNCNNINVSDVIDFDSNNSERTDNRTSIDDSFNQSYRR
jgi:hypothetical protein